MGNNIQKKKGPGNVAASVRTRQIIGALAIKTPNKQATLFDCIKMNIMVVGAGAGAAGLWCDGVPAGVGCEAGGREKTV